MFLFFVFLYFNNNVKMCDSLDKVRVVFVGKMMPVPHMYISQKFVFAL